MNNKIAKRLSSNSKALMDFQLLGKIPKLKFATKTPLWNLLSEITPMNRARIKSIRLSPKLGYNSSSHFNSAEHLFVWLGGNAQYGDWESRPCDSYCIGSFKSKLSLSLLLEHSSNHPDEDQIGR